jgi:hypothetical protein
MLEPELEKYLRAIQRQIKIKKAITKPFKL